MEHAVTVMFPQLKTKTKRRKKTQCDPCEVWQTRTYLAFYFIYYCFISIFVFSDHCVNTHHFFAILAIFAPIVARVQRGKNAPKGEDFPKHLTDYGILPNGSLKLSNQNILEFQINIQLHMSMNC